MIPGRLQQWNTTKSRDLDRVFGVPRGMQGNGGLHGVVSDTCEHRTDGMQGRSENVAHARAVDGLRLRRAPQSQLDLCAPSNPLFRSEQSEPLREEVAQTGLPREYAVSFPLCRNSTESTKIERCNILFFRRVCAGFSVRFTRLERPSQRSLVKLRIGAAKHTVTSDHLVGEAVSPTVSRGATPKNYGATELDPPRAL